MTHPLINQYLQYNFMPVAGHYRRRDLFLNDPFMSTEHYFQFEPQAGISFIPFVAAICISVAFIKSIISIQNSLNRKIFTLKIQKRPYP